MPKTLKLVSLKSLTFATVEYGKESIQDINTKRWEMQQVPLFPPVTPLPIISKLHGNRNGQNFVLNKHTYNLTEELANDTIIHKTGQPLDYYRYLDLFFTDKWIQGLLTTGDLKIELHIGDNSDKEVIKYLYEKGYIEDEHINNHNQYVEHKEGRVIKKARDFLYEDAKEAITAENDTVPHEAANSEMGKAIAGLGTPAVAQQATGFAKLLEDDTVNPKKVVLPATLFGNNDTGLPDGSLDGTGEIE